MFKDRKDAGKKLAKALEKYKGENPVVLAIPRGGVEVGYEVASYLDAELSVIISRKLPFPDNPESGFGAIAEDGSTFTFLQHVSLLPEEAVERITKEQKAEIKRRVLALRDGKPLPAMTGRTVILVDDGIAMGSTMRAAMKLCRKRGAGKLIVAAPVAGPQTKKDIAELADDTIILETPEFFGAVAQVYENWYDVPDEEVIRILKRKKRG